MTDQFSYAAPKKPRKSIRRGTVFGITLGTFLALGLAFAAVVVTSDITGYGRTGVIAQPLTSLDATGNVQTLLVPGGTADLAILIHNPNGFSLHVSSITAGAPVVVGATGPCQVTIDQSVIDAQLNGAAINGSGNTSLDAPGALSMGASPDPSCASSTITIPLHVVAS